MSKEVSGDCDDSSNGHCSFSGEVDPSQLPLVENRLWVGSLHRCLPHLSGIIRELSNLGSIKGRHDTVTCHPHVTPVTNLLPQLLVGLLIDSLQMSAPNRYYLGFREPLGLRSCLTWDGPHPRPNQCGRTNQPSAEQLRTILALKFPLGSQVRPASQLSFSLCPVLLPHIHFHRW